MRERDNKEMGKAESKEALEARSMEFVRRCMISAKEYNAAAALPCQPKCKLSVR